MWRGHCPEYPIKKNKWAYMKHIPELFILNFYTFYLFTMEFYLDFCKNILAHNLLLAATFLQAS